MKKRKPTPKPRALINREGQTKRNAEGLAAAKLNGFDTLSAMVTYIKNQAKRGIVTVIKESETI